jgi:hypothetical protein
MANIVIITNIVQTFSSPLFFGVLFTITSAITVTKAKRLLKPFLLLCIHVLGATIVMSILLQLSHMYQNENHNMLLQPPDIILHDAIHSAMFGVFVAFLTGKITPRVVRRSE